MRVEQMNEESWCPTVQVGSRQLCCFSSGGLFTPCCRRQAVVTVSAKTSSPAALLHNFWPATVPWGLTPTALHEGGETAERQKNLEERKCLNRPRPPHTRSLPLTSSGRSAT